MVSSPEGRSEAQPCGSYWLLDEVDAGLQVETKVDEVPLDALALVLLLLQDEHRVVEELLQLLIGVVDAELLEGVQLQEGDGVRQIPVAASEPPGRTGGVFGQNLLGPHRAAPCGPSLITPTAGAALLGPADPASSLVEPLYQDDVLKCTK